jgi:drug/metabolite transporter (DMT)-like permease
VHKRLWLAYIEVLFAVLAWGASFIATKVALREVSPVTVVWLRFAMGVAILGVAVIARKQFALPPAPDLVYFAILGFIGITFHQWLQSTALQTSQASTTAWIVATTPIFIALLAWIFLRERLGWWKVVGIALAAFGVLIVVSQGDFSAFTAGSFGASGDILILVSALNWAVFSVLSRRGLQFHPATRMMFYVMTIGWLFTSVLFFSGPGMKEIGQLSTAGWLGVGFLGVACSGLAYIFWYDALQALPASQVGAFLYIEPLVAVLVAAIILDEPLIFASLVGGAIILAGVWLVNRRR